MDQDLDFVKDRLLKKTTASIDQDLNFVKDRLFLFIALKETTILHRLRSGFCLG
jgi:hypothetical protein